MKLICTQENFKKAISNCERVVSKQGTLPILNNILFEAAKGVLKLSATNLEIGVVAKVGAKVENEGSITIPAKLISNFITNLPAGENISMEITDQSLRIKSGKARATLKGLAATDFPLIPRKNTDFLLSIPAYELKDALSKVLLCVAFNEARVELTGINLILGTDLIFLAATDSFRLAEYTIKPIENNINKVALETFLEKNSNIIIPASTFAELNRIIPNDSQELVKIAIEEGQIFFEFLGTRIVSRLINGKYPEYKHIMPNDYKTRVVGKKSVFLGAVRMASVFISAKSNEIALKIDSESKKVYTEGQSVEMGENSTELNFDITGPSQQVAFNPRYLLDGINSIGTNNLAVLINSESTPVAVREINETNGEVLMNYTYIVMPVKN
jgi:DNA polymerase-3 subunit beta